MPPPLHACSLTHTLAFLVVVVVALTALAIPITSRVSPTRKERRTTLVGYVCLCQALLERARHRVMLTHLFVGPTLALFVCRFEPFPFSFWLSLRSGASPWPSSSARAACLALAVPRAGKSSTLPSFEAKASVGGSVVNGFCAVGGCSPSLD